MVPCSFEESNVILSKPDNMSADDCTALSALQAHTQSGMPVLVSCWKITTEELDELQKTGRIWLTVCGEQMPPVILSGIKPALSPVD